MRPITTASAFLGLFAIAGAALAHDGVRNPAVLDRMENMSDLGDHVEVLVTMTRGTVPFNANAANAALIGLSQASEDIVPLFQLEERDPRDEASADIWTQFENFSALANDLEQASASLAGSIETSADLRPALRTVGQTCSACHDQYRVD